MAFALPAPSDNTPVTSIVVHGAFPVSSLSPLAHPMLLRAKLHHVQQPRAIRVPQINRLPARTQREAKLILIKHHKPARRNRRAIRDHKLVRRRVVRENAAGEIVRRVAVIVEFDAVQQRQIGVREDFVDEDVSQWIIRVSLVQPRRAARMIADAPCCRIVLAILRTRQHQRMSRAIRADGRRMIVAVTHLRHHAAHVVL